MPIDSSGNQSKIPSSDHHISKQKLLDGGGAKSNYGGGLNKKSSTRNTKFSTSWQGTTKGSTKHTYGAK